METRFLLTRRGCSHCNSAIKAIKRINLKLPIGKRIRIVDCSNWEEFSLRDLPIMDVFDKMGLREGYPFLYIDGIIVDIAPTPEQLKRLLTKFLEEDFAYEIT